MSTCTCDRCLSRHMEAVDSEPHEWVATVEAALSPDALGERIALSCLALALEQARAEVAALTAWKADAERFQQSLASIMLERRAVVEPTDDGPPRLVVVKAEGL